ncbi:aldo/keto reductase [Alteromonas pelagimontana]|uniref:Aldo/keto reductase n=1 Tax=Alteromonas pelagimontana TaxID=1858656 RepID=A0A6M4ME70_9ALTE|nr:aldo/keto reductase [Alteromonas pelagimontana]QJR81403.1 aldo/keto reductase [Alteromonas pelagimontana]
MLNKYFPHASRLIYGCMGLGGKWDQNPVTQAEIKQAQAIIEKALGLGINVFDHADIYTFNKAETAFGKVLADAPSLRDKMIIQSKCAIRFEDEKGPKRYDFSADWIQQSVEGSLSRLNIECLDILLLHRPDPLMELEEVADVLMSLIQAGKIKHVGVSNMHSQQIQFLQSALNTPIVANQLEMSLGFRDWVEDGITTGSVYNRDSGYAPGTLEYCMQHGVQLQAWGSLAQGKYTGAATEDEAANATAALVSKLAADYGVSKEAIVLGWLTRHPAGIQPVIGTTNVKRIEACAQVKDLILERGHWYALLETARGQELP